MDEKKIMCDYFFSSISDSGCQKDGGFFFHIKQINVDDSFGNICNIYHTSVAKLFVLLRASPAGLFGRFAPSSPKEFQGVTKFHADWTRTLGARRMQTDRQTDIRTNRPILII